MHTSWFDVKSQRIGAGISGFVPGLSRGGGGVRVPSAPPLNAQVNGHISGPMNPLGTHQGYTDGQWVPTKVLEHVPSERRRPVLTWSECRANRGQNATAGTLGVRMFGKISIAALALGLAACAAPTSEPTVTVTAPVAPPSPLTDFITGIRASQPAAADYNDRQLLFMGDQFCVVAADLLIEEWSTAGHDAGLLGAVASYVTAHPEYCEGAELVWPSATITEVG